MPDIDNFLAIVLALAVDYIAGTDALPRAGCEEFISRASDFAIAGILAARHLKTTENLFDTRDSPRTESMAAAAVQWPERIMQEIDIDNVTGRVRRLNPKTASVIQNDSRQCHV